MSTQLTLEIPDNVLRRATTVASATRRDVADVLQEALALAFDTLAAPEQVPTPVSELADGQVLALCDARLPEDAAARLSELLRKRQEGERDTSDSAELSALMQSYQSLWLRQSEALAEAVRRGLRPPLEP
jgi:hypothetical protein